MSKVSAVQWVTLTAFGLAFGLIGGILLGLPLGQIVNAMIVTAAVTCVAGGILGAFQAIGLRCFAVHSGGSRPPSSASEPGWQPASLSLTSRPLRHAGRA